MPDYKEMYLTMVRASERALRQLDAAREELIRAQQYCEERYLSDGEEEREDTPLTFLR